MSKILPVLALFVSAIALLFSGFFGQWWADRFDVANISVQVNNIEYFKDDVDQLEIELPSNLTKQSEMADIFPTLAERMTVRQAQQIVKEHESSDYKYSVMQLRAIKDSISNLDDTESAQSEWDNLRPETKALVMTFAAEKYVKLLMEEDLKKGDLQRMPNDEDTIERYLAKFAGEVIMPLERDAKAGAVRSVIDPYLRQTEAAVYEADKLAEELGARISEFTAGRGAGGQWVFQVNVSNSGRKTESVKPYGILAISNREGDDILVDLIPSDTAIKNFIIEPGKSVSIELLTFYKPSDEAKMRAVSNSFEVGERKYRVFLQDSSNELLSTPSEIFVKGLSVIEKEGFAEKVKLEGGATGG